MLLADILTRLRIAIDDNPGDKTVFKENLRRSLNGDQVGSGNQSFQLNNKRVTTGTIVALADGSTATIVSTADGLLRGRFTISSTAPTSSMLATYDYQFFTDTELTSFVNQATDFVGAADPTSVVAGLIDSLVFKAGSDACFALASRTGMLYDAQAGGKSASKGDLAKKYRDLAKDLFERATAERKAYYGDRKGASSSPASGMFGTGQRPYTPRR